MFTNLQAPSQICVERWLNGIMARFGNQELSGFQAHQNIERIEIFELAV